MKDEKFEDAIRKILDHIGDDSQREGLLETPSRVRKAYAEWFSGYGQDPYEVLKTFEDGAKGVDTMVLETDIPVHSWCEHHMAPITGVAHVAYIPNGRVVGLSKLVRVTNIFMRRLQVQERLGEQIAKTIYKGLKCKGAGVILTCRHGCMESRGVHSHGVVTTTSALKGAFKKDSDTRREFLSLVAATKSTKNSML